MVTKAFIFAAGLGTRLKPLTDTLPKALVPVCGKPLIWHVAGKLKSSGIDEAVVNVHHFADKVQEWIDGQDIMKMTVSDERQMLLETGGMRCFVIELHNGTCNSGGLSFNYGSLTYESDKDGAESIMEDYDDFSLERFPFVLHMWKHTTWCGDMTDMCSIDKKMALRLQSNGVDYLYATPIYGKDEILGFLGVTFAEGDYVDINKVRMASGKYASKLSILLDGVD